MTNKPAPDLPDKIEPQSPPEHPVSPPPEEKPFELPAESPAEAPGIEEPSPILPEFPIPTD